MTIALEESHRGSRKRRSRKRRQSRRARRATRVIGWSIVAIIMAAIFVAGAIYLLVSSTGVLVGR